MINRRLLALPLVPLALAASLFSRSAQAHKPSDSYLTMAISGGRIAGRWDIALRDLDYAMGLDANASGSITWNEVRTKKDAIAALALGKLALRNEAGKACLARAGDLRIAQHSDGEYAVLRFDAICPSEIHVLDVDYELFFDVDPQHRGIVRLDDGAGTRTAIFAATDRRQRFDRATTARGRQLYSAVKLGVEHIFAGIDHLLFLIALLLPSVLARRGDGGRPGGWEPVTRLRPALLDVLKIVTAFTVAHSITLTLSALEVLRLPSRFVESGIAASVIVAALNNVVPILGRDRWAAAFALGLLHGFGFSATLMDIGLPRENLVLTLFGFNVGVEIGQACVVLAFVPLAFLVRSTRGYRWGAVVAGSTVIAGVACVWLVERSFGVKIF